MVQYYKMGRLLFGCWDKITVFENGREKVALKITMFEKRTGKVFGSCLFTFSAVCLYFSCFFTFWKTVSLFLKNHHPGQFSRQMRLFWQFSTNVTNAWILYETGHNWIAILYFFLYLVLAPPFTYDYTFSIVFVFFSFRAIVRVTMLMDRAIQIRGGNRKKSKKSNVCSLS